MVCETPRQKSLLINRRGKFFGDPFFRDSWADYNSAVRRIVNRFNDGWINPSERIRDSQYHSMYRTLRSARHNYSTHSARFREEADCYKLIIDVHEFDGGEITVRTAGKTVSVRGKVEADSDGTATLRTEVGKQEVDSDTSSIISGRSTSSITLHKRYNLPPEADCDKIESALSKDAVLTVTIPKRTDVHYIPLEVEGREDNGKVAREKSQRERNGSLKRPNDSPLLSSRKKLQEDEQTKEIFPSWRRQSAYMEANKENNAVNAESVSARRSRFERFISNNSVDENKEERERRKDAVKRQKDKYEDAREVIIPIVLNKETQDKVLRSKKEKDDEDCSKEATKEQAGMMDKTKASTVDRNLLSWQNDTAKIKYNHTPKLETEGIKHDKQTKEVVSDVVYSADENVLQNGSPKISIPKKDDKDHRNVPWFKQVSPQKSDYNNHKWQKQQKSKRERSLDGIVSPLNADNICGSKFPIKDTYMESSVKSPKLETCAIPDVSLFSPELSDDAPEILINKEDNLKANIYGRLDTLDTPKMKSNMKSPSVTPGGREILIEKRQSLMEDDIFEDCWSDFSNTLQEVLNRLQELSSELGQSKNLAKSLTESEAQKLAVSGNVEFMDSAMKRTSGADNIWPVKVDGVSDGERDKSDIQSSYFYNKHITDPKATTDQVSHLLSEGPKNVSSFACDEKVIDKISYDGVYSHNKDYSDSIPPKSNSEYLDEKLLKISTPVQHIDSEVQNIPYKFDKIDKQLTTDSNDSPVEPAFAIEPVFERKIRFVPAELGTQTSVRANVLQSQKSVDLVLNKDLPAAAVSQSSSVCLNDSIYTGNISPVAGSCNNHHPRLYQNKEISVDDDSFNTVSNGVNNDCEFIHLYDTVGRNVLIDDKQPYKNTKDICDSKQNSYRGLNDVNSSSKKQFSGINLPPYEKISEFDANIGKRKSSESIVADYEATDKEKVRTFVEQPHSATVSSSGDISSPHFSCEIENKDHYYTQHDNSNFTKEAIASPDCEKNVDILNDDVMRRTAFSQNVANNPLGKASHLSSAKSGARRSLADLQQEKNLRSPPAHCDDNPNFADSGAMGNLLTRGRDSYRGRNKPQSPFTTTTPVLNENISPLGYSYRKEYPEDAPSVPSYIRQKSQPSKRFAGFTNVSSNNVRRIRDTLNNKPDKEASEVNTRRNRSSPSPTRSATNRAWSPSVDNKARRRSPSPLHSPLSPKHEPYTSFRNSPSRQRHSFSPTRSDTECLMNSREAPKRSSQKSSYFSPTFSSSQKAYDSDSSSKKHDSSYKCSSQDKKQFNKIPKKCSSPILLPKNERKEKNEVLNGVKLGAVPERKRQSENGHFKSKPEPSNSPRTHQRIFKRFRNANLQPDSEAIYFKEEEDRYKMVLDVEEFVPGEIEVLQDDGVLTVKGKIERKDGLNVSVRTFNRTFDIPRNSREEDIDSSLSEDGILTIFVPKKKERIIKIELVD